MRARTILVAGVVVVVIALVVSLWPEAGHLDDDRPSERERVLPTDPTGPVAPTPEADSPESSAEPVAAERDFWELIEALRDANRRGQPTWELQQHLIPLADRYAGPLSELFVSDPELQSDIGWIAFYASKGTSTGLGLAIGRVVPRLTPAGTKHALTVLWVSKVVLPDENVVAILRSMDSEPLPYFLQYFLGVGQTRIIRARTPLAVALFEIVATAADEARELALSALVYRGDRDVLLEVVALIGSLSPKLNRIAFRALAGTVDPSEALDHALEMSANSHELTSVARGLARTSAGRAALIDALGGEPSARSFDPALVALSMLAEEFISSEERDAVRRALELAWARPAPKGVDPTRHDEGRAVVILHLPNFMDDAEFSAFATRSYAAESGFLRRAILSGLWNAHSWESSTALPALAAILEKEEDDAIVRPQLETYRMKSGSGDPGVDSLNAFFRRWLRQGDRLAMLSEEDAEFARTILGD